MTMFNLTLSTDNAAFFDDADAGDVGEARNREIARILRQTAERIESGEDEGGLRDYNGNTVGKFAIS
jgi:hypothetical protein